VPQRVGHVLELVEGVVAAAREVGEGRIYGLGSLEAGAQAPQGSEAALALLARRGASCQGGMRRLDGREELLVLGEEELLGLSSASSPTLSLALAISSTAKRRNSISRPRSASEARADS
jgi:hypothetical protein